ncbi:hypothetical protein ACJQWK_10593 [Exserohilum turcicum]
MCWHSNRPAPNGSARKKSLKPKPTSQNARALQKNPKNYLPSPGLSNYLPPLLHKDAEAYGSKVLILSRQLPTPFSQRSRQSELEKKTKFHTPSLPSSRFQSEYEHLQLQ